MMMMMMMCVFVCVCVCVCMITITIRGLLGIDSYAYWNHVFKYAFSQRA